MNQRLVAGWLAALILFVPPLFAEEPKVLDPEVWKITVPMANSKGESMEILNPTFRQRLENPSLIPVSEARFYQIGRGEITFFTEFNGITTKNSDYCRTELREMRGNDEREWKLKEGGTLEVRLRVGPLKGGANKIIFAQIHGHEPKDKPLLKCLWEKGRIRILTKSGEKLKDHQIQAKYSHIEEGEWFSCRIEATADGVHVSINGDRIETIGPDLLGFWPADNSFYFKAGNYLQHDEKGKAATVTFSKIVLKH